MSSRRKSRGGVTLTVAVLILGSAFLPYSLDARNQPGQPDQSRLPDLSQQPFQPHLSLLSHLPYSRYQGVGAQGPERRAALEREADELARSARSLLAELQQLELERDRQAARVRDAEQAMAASAAALAVLDERLASLQQQRLARMPDLKRRFVDLYKRGRRGYVPLLMTATSVRDMARATRAAGALARMDQQGISAQRETLNRIRRERQAQLEQSRVFEEQRLAAEQARTAAARAVDIRAALLRQVDARRDLTARLAGELDTAATLLQDQVTSLASATPAAAATPLLLETKRGSLEWPVTGRLTRPFGRVGARPEGSATRNGVEIAAAADTPVRAVHPGAVAYAEPFTGFGTLVILDHGSGGYTLYGYLAGVGVRRGERVEAGQELGRVGTPPAGTPALYFELRVDGRPVDPVQWLKPR